MSISKTALEKLLEEVRTPEYKQKQYERNLKYLNDTTVDYELGFFVGEHIVNRYLPTLSTDMLKSRRVIEVSEEDKIENTRLESEWYETTRYGKKNEDENGNKEKWELYLQHNKMLEIKYLPNPLECHLHLIKFNDEKEFKKGLISSLWNCDMCSYNLDEENIKVRIDLHSGFLTISFQLD